MAGSVGSDYGSGGMITKILAGKIATKAGVDMLIASGLIEHPVKALFDGASNSWFRAQGNAVTSRKRWIAGGLKRLAYSLSMRERQRHCEAVKVYCPLGSRVLQVLLIAVTW